MSSTTKPKISVCIVSYSRPERLELIQKQLNDQTFQDFEVLIWDNTETNYGSQARFWLVKEAKGEAIVFIDDDESIEPEFIRYMWNQYKKFPKSLIGWFTRRFHKDSYWESIPPSLNFYGQKVDYVGTGGCIVEKKIFDNNPELYDIPDEFNKVEDLYLSYVAKREGYKLITVDGKYIKIEIDGKDQYSDLIDYKEEALRLLIEKGFETYADSST